MPSAFFPLVDIDQRIQLHLRLGGSVRDEVGQFLISRFIEVFLKIGSENSEKLSQGDLLFIERLRDGTDGSRLTRAELEIVLSSSIEGLMPNPCIRSVGPILAGALMFREPVRNRCGLAMLAEEVSQRCMPSLSAVERTEIIREISIEFAKEIQNIHDLARGACEFDIDSSGTGLNMKQARLKGVTGPWGCIIFATLGIIGICSAAFVIYKIAT
jgi:hypothetical protein